MWPDKSYYKKRLETGGANKYICPRGRKKPLFEANVYHGGGLLYIVEGELNALSLGNLPDIRATVVSPGGAAEFTSNKYLDYYSKFQMFIVCVDADKAGFDAAIKLKEILLKHSPRVSINLMERDFNDILVKDGQEGVQKEVQRMLGMPPKTRQANV